MKRGAAVLSLATALTVSACLQDDDLEFTYRTAWVDSVQVVSASMPAVEFKVFGAFPESCWDFTDTRVTATSPFAYAVVMNARRPRDRMCATVLSPFERELSVEVPVPGEYLFEFLRPSSESVRIAVHVSN